MVTGLPMVSCKDGVCLLMYSENIIEIVSTNVPLGMPRLHYSLWTVFKSCNLRKAFPFLCLSIHVTFSVTFTWKTINHPLLPFNLDSSCLSHVHPLK